jgi:hypothetical protein
MTKKDTQRKALAMMVLFFIAYLYVEKILTPYLQPPVEKNPFREKRRKNQSLQKSRNTPFQVAYPRLILQGKS